MRRRPHIPLKARCIVAMRQLEVADTYSTFEGHRLLGRSQSELLNILLNRLRRRLGSDVLRLDHDPALGLRDYDPFTATWSPDANDPDCLIYRTKEDHDRKTYIRGDGAQRSDTAEMKRRRRIKRREAERRSGKKKSRFQSRPFPKGKTKWPSRPFSK